MRKVKEAICGVLFLVILFIAPGVVNFLCGATYPIDEKIEASEETEERVKIDYEIQENLEKYFEETKNMNETQENVKKEEPKEISAEIKLLAEIINIEAGGESEECQRAVCDVILNRLNSGLWGDTLPEVIHAKHDGVFEFESVYYLGLYEVPREFIIRVNEWAKEESTLAEDILFFRSDYYHRWNGAIDEFQIGNMYFSSSIWCK